MPTKQRSIDEVAAIPEFVRKFSWDGAPTQTLEQAVLAQAQLLRWMPINDQAALYAYAQSEKLGYPQTDEFYFEYAGERFVAQVYNGGIVYAKEGDWGNCHVVGKPGAVPASDGSPA